MWLDDALVYRNTGVTLGTSQFDSVLVGAEHQNQEGVVAADDVVVKTLQAPDTPEVFADGFESANFADWSAAPSTGGDGSGAIQSTVTSSGSHAARVTASATSGSFAYVRKTMRAAQTDLTVEADVNVLSEGAAGGTTPLLGFNDPGGIRLVTVVRQNQNADRIALQYAGTTFATTGTLPLGQFKTIRLRTITFGPGRRARSS